MPFVHRGYWPEGETLRAIDWNVAATVHQTEPQLILIQTGRYIELLPDHYAALHVKARHLRAIKPSEIGCSCHLELHTPARRRVGEIGTAFIETARRMFQGA